MADIDFEPWPAFGRQQLGQCVHFIRGLGDELNESLQELRNPSRWVSQRSRKYLDHRMKLVLQRRDNSKIAASSANRPKKVRVRLLAGFDASSVHGNHLRR